MNETSLASANEAMRPSHDNRMLMLNSWLTKGNEIGEGGKFVMAEPEFIDDIAPLCSGRGFGVLREDRSHEGSDEAVAVPPRRGRAHF